MSEQYGRNFSMLIFCVMAFWNVPAYSFKNVLCNFYCKSRFLSYKNIYFVIASPQVFCFFFFNFTWLLFHQFTLKYFSLLSSFHAYCLFECFIFGLQVELCGACFTYITDGYSWGSSSQGSLGTVFCATCQHCCFACHCIVFNLKGCHNDSNL